MIACSSRDDGLPSPVTEVPAHSYEEHFTCEFEYQCMQVVSQKD